MESGARRIPPASPTDSPSGAVLRAEQTPERGAPEGGAPVRIRGHRILSLLVLAAAACAAPNGEASGGGADQAGRPAAAPSGEAGPPPTVAYTAEPADWDVAEAKVRWARDAERHSLGFGELMAALGETFVGTTYEPQTLEQPGPERLVVNLRALDCVTFVENVLALARLSRTLDPQALGDTTALRQAFRAELQGIRYRGGRLDGYASRLHYFSEWLSDNETRGTMEEITAELGGTVDPEPVQFMSSHPDAYRQLEDQDVLAQIAQIEARLGRLERYYIPQDEIDEKAHLIQTGDIIAATSTVSGLDVAHTGIAVWKDGVLRLLHAPLVGSSVELSERSLAERIQSIAGQDGIMVARPLDPTES